MGKGILFLLGEFGTGKDYLSEQLEKLYGEFFHKILQVSTREKRSCEIDGVDGHFISKERFLSLIEEKSIISWSLVERTGNYYGNLYSEFDFNKVNIITGDPERLSNLLEDKEKFRNVPIWVVYLRTSKEIRMERYSLRDANYSEKEMEDRMKDERFTERMNECKIFNYLSFWNDNVTPEEFLHFVRKMICDMPNGMLV